MLPMYGTRDAAQNWASECTDKLLSWGFVRGKATPCIFYHPGRNLRVAVHGDDFTILGHSAQLDWFQKEIRGKFDLKVRGRLGPAPDDEKSTRILNRVITWTKQGIEYEADQQHAEIIIRTLGLKGNSRSINTPGNKILDGGPKPDDEDLLAGIIPEHPNIAPAQVDVDNLPPLINSDTDESLTFSD